VIVEERPWGRGGATIKKHEKWVKRKEKKNWEVVTRNGAVHELTTCRKRETRRWSSTKAEMTQGVSHASTHAKNGIRAVVELRQ